MGKIPRKPQRGVQEDDMNQLETILANLPQQTDEKIVKEIRRLIIRLQGRGVNVRPYQEILRAYQKQRKY